MLSRQTTEVRRQTTDKASKETSYPSSVLRPLNPTRTCTTHPPHRVGRKTWWLWRGLSTRSLPELGREIPQRPWYCVPRRGRVGRRQVLLPRADDRRQTTERNANPSVLQHLSSVRTRGGAAR